MPTSYIEIKGDCADPNIESVDVVEDATGAVEINLTDDDTVKVITLSIEELEDIVEKAREQRDLMNPYPDNGGW